MAYCLHKRKDAGAELSRVLREQNAKALVLLRDWQADPTDRVHRARQSFKRLRAALRLIQRADPYVYSVENRFYRDQARSLSYARDAAAMIEVVDALTERVWESLPRQSLMVLRRSLEQRAEREMIDGISGIANRVNDVCADLQAADERLAHLPLRRLGKRDLRKGARRTLRRAMRGFARSVADPSDEVLHDWRKDVKYAYYQAGLLRELRPAWSRRYRPALGNLAEILGHAQDLAVLDGLLRAQPDDLGIDLHLQRLQRLVRQARRETRGRARGLGGQIFGAIAAPLAELVDFPAAGAERHSA